MLKVENLDCGYGAVRAVRGVSFELPAGSILALLGPNGAGKTTTIMAIMGHVDIHGGHIWFDGKEITRRRAVQRVTLGLALVPELSIKSGLLDATGLVARPLASPAPTRTIALVARRSTARTAEFSALAECAVDLHRRRRGAVTTSIGRRTRANGAALNRAAATPRPPARA